MHPYVFSQSTDMSTEVHNGQDAFPKNTIRLCHNEWLDFNEPRTVKQRVMNETKIFFNIFAVGRNLPPLYSLSAALGSRIQGTKKLLTGKILNRSFVTITDSIAEGYKLPRSLITPWPRTFCHPRFHATVKVLRDKNFSCR